MKLFGMIKKAALGLFALCFAATVFAQAAPTTFAGITLGTDISAVTGQTLTEIVVPNNKSNLQFFSTTGGASAPGSITLSNIQLLFKNGKFQGGRGSASISSGQWTTAQTSSVTAYGPVSQIITSITRTSATATATKSAHGYTTGDYVVISGANQTDYNIGATITVLDANTFTYTVANAPVTPATGSLSAAKAMGPLVNTTQQHTATKKWRTPGTGSSTEVLLEYNSTTTMLFYSVRKY